MHFAGAQYSKPWSGTVETGPQPRVNWDCTAATFINWQPGSGCASGRRDKDSLRLPTLSELPRPRVRLT